MATTNTLKINNLKSIPEVVIKVEFTRIFNIRLALMRFFIKLASISAGFGIRVEEVERYDRSRKN